MLEDLLSEKHHKRKERRVKLWLLTVGISIVLAAVVILWFVFRSPFWHIRGVTVRGNRAVAARDIEDLVKSDILKNHDFWKSLLGMDDILIWPSGRLPASETAMLPQLADLSVSKNYFTRTITLAAVERQAIGTWCLMQSTSSGSGETCYWFDASGTVFQKALDTQGGAFLAVHDYSQTYLGLGEKILPNAFVANMLTIMDVVKISGLQAKEIALKDLSLQEIDVSTQNGPEVYFSLRFPADEYLPVLQGLMAKPGFDKLQYVDFRVANRAYYR
ncbi:MAG: hypothetical protein KGJ13_02610 [Patescibacteria group bacterium]|nr:hypothetical protein [Patescibacteria group bacterium]